MALNCSDLTETVSIIIPVFNAKNYLPRCLQAIESQSFTNLEIILVDDGSTDGSGWICDDFALKECRAKVVHQQNKGLWAARNAGIDASSGSYLFFPDADDFFHRDIILLMYDAINQGKTYDLAIVRKKQTWQTEEDVSSVIEPSYLEMGQEELIAKLFDKRHDQCSVFMWNKLYRRSLIENMRVHEYLRSEDFDFNYRVFLKVSKAILIDNDLYYWYQHPGSLTKDSRTPFLDATCLVRSYYRNYINFSSAGKDYGHLLLQRLYRSMVLCKARALSLREKSDVFRECREYELATRKAYLKEKRIRLFERISCFSLIRCPHLARLLLQATNNL